MSFFITKITCHLCAETGILGLDPNDPDRAIWPAGWVLADEESLATGIAEKEDAMCRGCAALDRLEIHTDKFCDAALGRSPLASSAEKRIRKHKGQEWGPLRLYSSEELRKRVQPYLEQEIDPKEEPIAWLVQQKHREFWSE